MVKGVEELTAELERFALRQPDVLLKGEVPVIEARTVEEFAAGGPELAQGLFREQRFVEIGICTGVWVILARDGDVERAGGEVRRIDALSGGAGEARAQYRPVTFLANPHGDTPG